MCASPPEFSGTGSNEIFTRKTTEETLPGVLRSRGRAYTYNILLYKYTHTHTHYV